MGYYVASFILGTVSTLVFIEWRTKGVSEPLIKLIDKLYNKFKNKQNGISE